MSDPLTSENRLAEIRKLAENDLGQECDSIIPALWLLALVECAEALKAGLHDGRLQSLGDRERFRSDARFALARLEAQ